MQVRFVSLYDDLQAKILESDAEEAVEILQDVWEQGVDMARLTGALLEPASASLQLRFDTPHAMICLDSLLQLLPMLPAKDRLYFVEWFIRYLSGLPKLFLGFEETEKIGSFGARNAKRGYVRSLSEHKVYNGFYYALRSIEEGGLEDYLHQCLEIAAHEIDFLGHVFIYTHTLSRLCRLVKLRQTKTLIFQLTEFLARRARVEPETLQKEGRELDNLIPMAIERMNILGHNVILAHKIHQVVDHLEGRHIEHLASQLARNVENSPDRFSRDEVEDVMAGPREETEDPLGALRNSLIRGNERHSIYFCGLYLESFGPTADLFSTLGKFLLAKDSAQPHHIIFPQAVFDLVQILDQPYVEVALARVIRMICGPG